MVFRLDPEECRKNWRIDAGFMVDNLHTESIGFRGVFLSCEMLFFL